MSTRLTLGRRQFPNTSTADPDDDDEDEEEEDEKDEEYEEERECCSSPVPEALRDEAVDELADSDGGGVNTATLEVVGVVTRSLPESVVSATTTLSTSDCGSFFTRFVAGPFSVSCCCCCCC